jgi:hypothetical protein
MFGLVSAVSALCVPQYRLRIPPGYLRSLSMTRLHYGDIDLAFVRRISCFALAAESMSARRLRLSVERSASSTRECLPPCRLRSDSPRLQTMIWKMSIGELLGARHAGPRWNAASETRYCGVIGLALGLNRVHWRYAAGKRRRSHHRQQGADNPPDARERRRRGLHVRLRPRSRILAA